MTEAELFHVQPDLTSPRRCRASLCGHTHVCFLATGHAGAHACTCGVDFVGLQEIAVQEEAAARDTRKEGEDRGNPV